MSLCLLVRDCEYTQERVWVFKCEVDAYSCIYSRNVRGYVYVWCNTVCVCIISESNTERKICFFPYFIIIHVHGKVQLFSVNS